MQTSRSKTKIAIGILVIVVASVLVYRSVARKPDANMGTLDAFARCLAKKGAVMYGAYWCSVCQNQKKIFGDSFRFIPYVECSEEPQKCVDAGIKGYPTWTLPGSGKLEGGQEIEKLSQESGCPLNN